MPTYGDERPHNPLIRRFRDEDRLVLNVFGFLTNVLAATHTDSISPDQAFYLVGARNGCGSSGEEPF